MRLYLSGPMTGKPEFNHAEFNKAAAILREAGHEVFNPAETNFGRPLKAVTHREALAVDLLWICQHAEGIALLEGWEQSRGAQAEVAVGRAIGCCMGLVGEYL